VVLRCPVGLFSSVIAYGSNPIGLLIIYNLLSIKIVKYTSHAAGGISLIRIQYYSSHACLNYFIFCWSRYITTIQFSRENSLTTGGDVFTSQVVLTSLQKRFYIRL